MKLSGSQREILKMKFDGLCAYCGGQLGARWHADHLLPIERRFIPKREGGFRATGESWKPENDTLENMMPSCAPCNISKATLSLDDWRKWLLGHVRSLNAYNRPYRLAKAYGLIHETNKPVVFYFEAARTQEAMGEAK